MAETCVFAKQSLGPIHCGPLGLRPTRLKLSLAPRGVPNPKGHPFSRSYGAILPSSLTRVLPCALGCSPRLPVSVCGTGTTRLARGFSCQCGCKGFATSCFTPHHGSRLSTGICHCALSHRLDRHFHRPAPSALLRPPVTKDTHESITFAGPVWRHVVVQESPPVVHRLRFSASA